MFSKHPLLPEQRSLSPEQHPLSPNPTTAFFQAVFVASRRVRAPFEPVRSGFTGPMKCFRGQRHVHPAP